MSLSPKRVGRVTASRAGAILGLSPFAGPDDVLREMVREHHGAEREFTGNVATEWGNQHEADAVAEAEFACGVEFSDTGDQQKFYPYEDWLGATPDGVWDSAGGCLLPDGWRLILEVKCPYSARATGKFKPLGDQLHYYAQIQVAMLCAGADACRFVQWSPVALDFLQVGKDSEWLAENLPKLKAFHERYLSELDNPAHLAPLRGVIHSEDAAELLAEYDQAKVEIEAATARQKAALDALIALSGESDAEICGRKLTKVVREGSISYAKALKDLAPDADLSDYKGKASEYWRLT
jgi:putative phage-type endonuclease